MKLIILPLLFIILLGCKSNTINKSLEKVAGREDITPFLKIPKKRTNAVVFFEYDLLKKQYGILKIQIDTFQCKSEKKPIIDSLSYPNRNSISISSKPKIDSISSNLLKAMIRELSNNLKHSNDLLNLFIDNQIKIDSIEMAYNKEILEYYKNLSQAIEIEFHNQAIDQCDGNKKIMELKVNDLRTRFEIKRAEILVLYRPNLFQNLFKTERHKVYESIQYNE